jgi:hypothetical protein
MIPLLRLYYNKLAFNILRRHTNPHTPCALASAHLRATADHVPRVFKILAAGCNKPSRDRRLTSLDCSLALESPLRVGF